MKTTQWDHTTRNLLTKADDLLAAISGQLLSVKITAEERKNLIDDKVAIRSAKLALKAKYYSTVYSKIRQSVPEIIDALNKVKQEDIRRTKY